MSTVKESDMLNGLKDKIKEYEKKYINQTKASTIIDGLQPDNPEDIKGIKDIKKYIYDEYKSIYDYYSKVADYFIEKYTKNYEKIEPLDYKDDDKKSLIDFIKEIKTRIDALRGEHIKLDKLFQEKTKYTRGLKYIKNIFTGKTGGRKSRKSKKSKKSKKTKTRRRK